MTISNYQNINETFDIENAVLEIGNVLRNYPSDYINIRELFLDIMPKNNLKKIDKKYNVDKVTVNKLVNELIKNDIIIVKSYDKNGVPDIVKIKRNEKCYSQIKPESIKFSEKDLPSNIDGKNVPIYEIPRSSKSFNNLNCKEKHYPDVVFEERKYYFITNDKNKRYHDNGTTSSNNRRSLYVNDKAKPVGYVDPISNKHRRICILNDKYKPYHLKRYPSTKEIFVGEVIDMLMENGEMSIQEIINYFWKTYYINLDLNYVNKLFKSGYNDIGYALYNIISDITIRKDNDSREMYLKYTPKYMREYILI